MNKVFFQEVFEIIDPSLEVKSIQSLSGGCINQAFKISTKCGLYFIKLNKRELLNMFQSEALGLELLASTETVRIPKAFGVGVKDVSSYLVLEFIEPGSKNVNFWTSLGSRLANLHQTTSAEFGLAYNNFIGPLPQLNTFKSNWVDFFIQNRLLPQINIGKEKGIIDFTLEGKFQKLFSKLPDLLKSEKPSLLHGDLWSGNMFPDSQEFPVLVDPAVYFGHREVEIGMTKLFGGFDKKFSEAYQFEFPLEKGFEERFDLYNLYPLLVHANLFGPSYLNDINLTLKKYV